MSESLGSCGRVCCFENTRILCSSCIWESHLCVVASRMILKHKKSSEESYCFWCFGIQDPLYSGSLLVFQRFQECLLREVLCCLGVVDLPKNEGIEFRHLVTRGSKAWVSPICVRKMRVSSSQNCHACKFIGCVKDETCALKVKNITTLWPSLPTDSAWVLQFKFLNSIVTRSLWLKTENYKPLYESSSFFKSVFTVPMAQPVFSPIPLPIAPISVFPLFLQYLHRCGLSRLHVGSSTGEQCLRFHFV